MLRYLLLTGDPAPLLWCDGLALRGDVVTAVYATDSLSLEPLRAKLPSATCQHFSLPEDVQVPENCDAVLVSGNDPRLFIAARQLGQSGLPILVVTTTSGPTSALFELIPLWEEARSPLVPAFTSGLNQIAAKLNTTKPLERIEFVRDVSPEESSRQLLTEPLIHRWFFQDVRWLTRIADVTTTVATGSWESVQAVWTGQRESEVAQAMVTLSGEHVPEANWIVRPATEQPGWKLTLWSGGPPTVLTSSEYPDALPADIAATLQQFTEAVHGTHDSSWNEVLQCGHLLAAVQRSAMRQRKVPVHFEEVSERSQFKTQMSAFGCGVLLWAMFGTIFMLAVAGTMDPRDREQRTAQAAGFVMNNTDFTPQAAELSESGRIHLQQIAANWSSTTAPVVFDTSSLSPETAAQSRDHVRTVLTERYLEGIEGRLVIRPVTGLWFERAVFLGWCVVFVPLGLFLLFQMLIAASHPGRPESNDTAPST